ncbi:sulfatase-like hydrolase/transferase, partial [bacterium]|nr:sulfatase-like hydrolase/transferase [bacterium]
TFNIRNLINTGQLQATQEDLDYIIGLYDANLAYGDWQVGQIIQKLQQLGIDDNTIIIVLSDHGEAFWEHGYQGHNSQLYEESIHVPLVIKLAGRQGIKKQKILQKTSTVDIFPTLVDLMSFSRKGLRFEGKSFLPYVAGLSEEDREIIVTTVGTTSYAYMVGDHKYLVHMTYDKEALRSSPVDRGRFKEERATVLRELYRTGISAGFLTDLVSLGFAVEELYDLKNDPLERSNLIHQDTLTASYLRARLLGWMADHKRPDVERLTEKAVLDESVLENLKALGYIDQTKE